MPLYDYQCKQCQTVTEVRHGFKETYTEPCPSCGGTLARVFNPAGIVFKGSGFYITDSRGDAGASGSTSAPVAAPTPAATETKKSDAA